MGDPVELEPSSAEAEGRPALASSSEAPEDWATRYKYLLAEFDNYRKRTDRERETSQARIRGALLRSLLPIYEAFERARAIAGTPGGSGDGLRRGIELLESEWRRLLQEEGVEPVARVGEPFAPDQEEAVGEGPTTEAASDGAVTEIVQQGYRFRGGLLRPAKVVVARSPAPSGSEDSAARAEPPASGEER